MVPNVKDISLDRMILVHRVILLFQLTVDYCPLPFKFFNAWLLVDGFDDMIKEE